MEYISTYQALEGQLPVAPAQPFPLDFISEVPLVQKKSSKELNLENCGITFREILPEDVHYVRKLNEDCFPLKYDEKFYQQLIDNSGMVTIVAVHKGEVIIGAITFQTEEFSFYKSDNLSFSSNSSSLNKHVSLSHSSYLKKNYKDQKERNKACYILTLAVNETFRRFGIASVLIDKCVEMSKADSDCKIVFLHVIDYNSGAIKFYEKHQFKRQQRLKDFYHIDGERFNAYLYALNHKGEDVHDKVQDFDVQESRVVKRPVERDSLPSSLLRGFMKIFA